MNPEEILKNYPDRRATMRNWLDRGQLDIVSATVELLKREIANSPDDPTFQMPAHKRNLRTFFSDLPPDLKVQVLQWLESHKFTGLTGLLRPGRTTS